MFSVFYLLGDLSEAEWDSLLEELDLQAFTTLPAVTVAQILDRVEDQMYRRITSQDRFNTRMQSASRFFNEDVDSLRLVTFEDFTVRSTGAPSSFLYM